MITYTTIDRTPYTYLIGWSKLNKWYYGVQCKKNCHPNNLWKTYFTSSKHVKLYREYNGEPDIIIIKKIFDNIDKARNWEHKVLRRLKARQSNKWLNKSDTKIHQRLGVLHSEHTKIKMSISRKNYKPMLGKFHSDETKRLMKEKRKLFTDSARGKEILAQASIKSANKRRGVSHPYQDKINKNPEKIRKTMDKIRGLKRTPEQKLRMSIAAKNRKQRIIKKDNI